MKLSTAQIKEMLAENDELARRKRAGRSDRPLKNYEGQGADVPNAGSGHHERREARSFPRAGEDEA